MKNGDSPSGERQSPVQQGTVPGWGLSLQMEEVMGQRYWVVGGDYSDCAFRDLKPGTERVSGPFHDELRARMEWQRLTFRDHCSATERYSICMEPPVQ